MKTISQTPYQQMVSFLDHKCPPNVAKIFCYLFFIGMSALLSISILDVYVVQFSLRNVLIAISTAFIASGFLLMCGAKLQRIYYKTDK